MNTDDWNGEREEQELGLIENSEKPFLREKKYFQRRFSKIQNQVDSPPLFSRTQLNTVKADNKIQTLSNGQIYNPQCQIRNYSQCTDSSQKENQSVETRAEVT